MKNLANYITACRIVGALALLLTRPLSAWFYILFIFCGGTDMVDGLIARRTGTESKTGAALDSIADVVLVAVCLYMLLPIVDLPLWICIWVAVIAVIKIINIISGYAYRRSFTMLHTAANKVTGALMFMLPLTLGFLDIRYSAACICAVATFAAVQEGHFIRTGRE